MEIPSQYSDSLRQKIQLLRSRMQPLTIGESQIEMANPLWLAPMSAICTAPFRVFMEELGAGLTVSELVSCHGINHGNERTIKMLKLHPKEKNVGLQLFGEDAEAMAKAAQRAQEFEPKFIDINMGCPVRKVVSKGGGSALMKDTSTLGKFFGSIKKAIEVPLTIKIRTGWDMDSRNADEIIKIAHNEGVEFVAIHGRTRTQQYKGDADWNYIESLVDDSPLPLIGNGDLHSYQLARKRMRQTKCQALMLGRGPLRNPFLFLEAFKKEEEDRTLEFYGSDYWEVTYRLFELLQDHAFNERTLLVQLRKHVLWFVTGFNGASHFRKQLFEYKTMDEVLKVTKDYFYAQEKFQKQLDFESPFMTSGHG